LTFGGTSGVELPRFLTFGLGVTADDGANLWRLVDDDTLLELLVLVSVLLVLPLGTELSADTAAAISVDCEVTAAITTTI